MGGITSTPVINRRKWRSSPSTSRGKPVVDRRRARDPQADEPPLSCDHRSSTAGTRANFLQDLKKYVENPLKLLSA
jgi:2-oxoisovalerate dehydrogenase E2 component (dihydrolipoyl transacylase)